MPQKKNSKSEPKPDPFYQELIRHLEELITAISAKSKVATVDERVTFLQSTLKMAIVLCKYNNQEGILEFIGALKKISEGIYEKDRKLLSDPDTQHQLETLDRLLDNKKFGWN